MRLVVYRFVLLSCSYLVCGTSPGLSSAVVPATVELQSFSCSPASFTGIGKSTCTIEFSGKLTAAQIVYFTSTAPVKAPVPKSDVVPKNATRASFTIKIGAIDVTKTVTLTATANGVSKTAKIRLIAYVAKIESNPTSLAFGPVTVGKSLAKSIVISSVGTAPLKITAIDSSRAVFKASAVGLPLTLLPGKKHSLVITFAPKTAAPLTASLKLTSNASTTPLLIDLRGTGTPSVLSSLSCSESTLRAGAQTDACTVKLTGPASGNLSIKLESSNVAVNVPSSVTILNGSSFATFNASVTWVSTAQRATITASEDGIAALFNIQLTAATASLSAQISSISFGDVPVDGTDTQSFSMLSSGTEPITINSIAVTGTGLTVTGIAPPLTLNPGGTISALVVFAPMSGGDVTGSITINTTASSGQPLQLRVTGTGVLYEVNLSWNAPVTSDAIAGYNIYRAETGSSAYTAVNSALVSGTTYMDKTVVNGTFYIYYVETVDTSGVSSAPSVTLTEQVP